MYAIKVVTLTFVVNNLNGIGLRDKIKIELPTIENKGKEQFCHFNYISNVNMPSWTN